MSMVSRFLGSPPNSSAWRAGFRCEPSQSAGQLSPDSPRHSRPACGAPYFAASGGVATGTDVADRLRDAVAQPVSVLARWIVQRQVIAFSSGGEMLLPLFQFDFVHGCVRGGIASALAELADVMTDDEVASWFDRPNGWLNGAAPAQVLQSDARGVIDAARADRFVVKG